MVQKVSVAFACCPLLCFVVQSFTNDILLVTRWAGQVDKKGRKLFTPETKKTITECIKNAKFLQDPPNVDLEDMYGKILPTAGMKHGLPFKTSMRGESRVEQMQGQQQHFANLSMRSEVADEYIMRGMCRSNARIQQRLNWNEMESEHTKREFRNG